MSTAHTILVADDSLTIRKLVETVLSKEGYKIITAQTGAECLSMAASQKPNLILLDYILPDMQGTEVCRSLINSPETWEIPVLMMSSNGTAIRQLYQDLNNVTDYLTKPFAPNVLKAVVGHILQKDVPAAAAPVAAPAPAVPDGFVDKVNRLLGLMENKPEAAPASDTRSRPARPRRARKSATAAQASAAMQRKFRLAVQKHLRGRLVQIPDWELRRGLENAEEFYLERLLSKDVLGDLSAELLKAAGMPPQSEGVLRCPASLVALDTMLRHLQAERASGELRVETAEETVLICLDQGQVALVTSNNPRNYCAGAACDFQSVPHTVIGEAVRAQEEHCLPFFLSLRDAGYMAVGADLDGLLQTQGSKCLARAFKNAGAVLAFYPLTRLPALVRACKLTLPLNQLLLTCYRTVDDWFTLEKAFPDMEATLVPTPECDAQRGELALEPQETRLLELVRAGRTVAEVAEAAQLKSFEVCRILFRFIRLGLLRFGARRLNDERVDDPLPEPVATAPAEPSPAQELAPPAVDEAPAATAGTEAEAISHPAEPAAAPVAAPEAAATTEFSSAPAVPAAQ